MTEFGAGGGQNSLRELREYDLEKRMRAIELQQATLMHLPDDVRKLADAVQVLASKLPAAAGAQTDQLALGIHNLAQAIAKQQQPHTTAGEIIKLLQTQPPGSSGKTWALVGALAMIAMFLGWQAFVG